MMRDLPVKSYIVRVYRRDKGRPPALVGIVEEVGTARKRAFTTFDELREILSRKMADRLQGRKDASRL